MGMEPYSVTSSLRAVLAMRLVRRLCDRCGGAASGCADCGGTGYRGRVPIVEFATIGPELRKLILASSDSETLARELTRGGLRTLRQRANDAVAAKITSAAEVERVLGPEG